MLPHLFYFLNILCSVLSSLWKFLDMDMDMSSNVYMVYVSTLDTMYPNVYVAYIYICIFVYTLDTMYSNVYLAYVYTFAFLYIL